RPESGKRARRRSHRSAAHRRGIDRRARCRARAARSTGTACRRAAADRRRRPGRECRAPRRGKGSSCRRTADSRGIRACYRLGMWTVAQLSADLAAGRTTSRDLVEQALSRIAAPEGEGARAFLKLYTDTARAEAEFSDRLRRAGIRRSPVDGLPISLKDLFDVAGDVTRAGSKIRAEAPPAKADAPAVARLRAAGAVILGRTNMVEFAFGGVGLNPHFGTPKNPYDRKAGRVPGGSSSGAAVAQADGMCVMALGTDTRGSIRGPSALCGVVGFKPTARRVPREGAFPLSFALDSVGPLANSVACCAAYDAVLSGEPDNWPTVPVQMLRLLLPLSSALEDLDAQVSKAFESALERLSKAGALIVKVPVPAFDRQPE